jgi:hypothetical protein
MSGVSQEVTKHTLNIKPRSKPIKQGLRCFSQEKRWAVGEELSRLLATGFVKEVQHPDWIANLVLVLKKNGNGEFEMILFLELWPSSGFRPSRGHLSSSPTGPLSRSPLGFGLPAYPTRFLLP